MEHQFLDTAAAQCRSVAAVEHFGSFQDRGLNFSDTATAQSQESQPVNGETEERGASPHPQPKRSLKMTYEEYRQLGNLLILHMRRQEEENLDGACD